MFNTIGIIVGLALLGVIAFFAFTQGVDRGASAAAKQHELAINRLEEAFQLRIESRDEEWQARVDEHLATLAAHREQRDRDLARERELASELDRTRREHSEFRDSIRTVEAGECRVSPEFDARLRDTLPQAR